MNSIIFKELNAFFSSLIGYIAIGIFLLTLSLFLWVFSSFNVLDYGYATLDGLFGLAPLVLMILIPAITMRSFAEETSLGTIETLVTRPLKVIDIVLGKFLACLILVLVSILPTLIYYVSVCQLGSPVGNIDHGAFWGSFIALLLLGGAFVSIGIFSSSLVKDQIVAFVIGLVLCSFMYLGFEYLSELFVENGQDSIIQEIGMSSHFIALGRGLVDTRDLVYFLSVIIVFILFSKFTLERRFW